jgi:hypothetical protein
MLKDSEKQERNEFLSAGTSMELSAFLLASCLVLASSLLSSGFIALNFVCVMIVVCSDRTVAGIDRTVAEERAKLLRLHHVCAHRRTALRRTRRPNIARPAGHKGRRLAARTL